MVDIRAKGQNGEREICDMLNGRLYLNLQKRKMPLPTVPVFQRNQNQSAVGGSDITNKLNLSIEVKRQEQLSVNTWWKQCVAAAERSEEIPVLIYRQNKQSWRVVTIVQIPLFNPQRNQVGHTWARAEIDLDSFLHWFDAHCDKFLDGGVNVYSS